MKHIGLVFVISKFLLVCLYAKISIGNGQFVRPYDNKIHKIFLRTLLRASPNFNNWIQERRVQDAKGQGGFRDNGYRNFGRYSPFFTYKPNFIPISYYGKRGNGNTGDTNLDDGEIKFEKRSVEPFVRSESNEYESLMNAIKILQSEKGSDLNKIIHKYDDGLQQVLELLLPPLSPDKLENIKSLLNSMIKRRFGSWGGKKRSEFYSWGGRKKRDPADSETSSEFYSWGEDQAKVKLHSENNKVRFQSKITDNEDGVENSSDKLKESEYKNEMVEESKPMTTKRQNDFYPWGGKRTLPPLFYQF